MESLAAKPCTLRLVTCVVLMLSDVDVFFSVLFIRTLNDTGGIFHYFLFVTIFGIFTYAVGIMLVGPTQKYKVLEMVANLMRSNPEEFVSSKFLEIPTGEVIDKTDGRFRAPGNEKCRVTMGSQLKPKIKQNIFGHRPSPKTFAELEKAFHDDYFAFLPFHGSARNDAVAEFEEAMHVWGLAAIWDACKIKNASNCVEIRHGLPGFRLACFGFQPEPSAKDLAGILNANALYSATTGVVQIAFGCVLVNEYGISINVLIPLTISFASIVLSGFNVLLDFAGKLAKLDTEKMMSDKIQRTNKKVLEEKVARKKIERDKKLDDIDSQFDQKQGNAQDNLLAKKQEKKVVNEAFAIELRDINKSASDELALELDEYREALKREREILSGKASSDSSDGDQESTFATAKRRQKQMSRKSDEIESNAEKKLEALQIDDPKFSEKAEAIIQERDKNLAAVTTLTQMNSGIQGSGIRGNSSGNSTAESFTDLEAGSNIHTRSIDRQGIREMMANSELLEHYNNSCTLQAVQRIRKAANADTGLELWKVRKIANPQRLVFQSLDVVNAHQVQVLMRKISAQHFSGFINCGTHGAKDGSHAGDPNPGAHYCEFKFVKQDMASGDEIGHWGIHIVSDGCPPDYPRVNCIINAWCHSDGKRRVQPGSGLPPMKIRSKLPNKVFLKLQNNQTNSLELMSGRSNNTSSSLEEWNFEKGRLVPQKHPGLCITALCAPDAPLTSATLVLRSLYPAEDPKSACQRWTIDPQGRILSIIDAKVCVAAKCSSRGIDGNSSNSDSDSESDSATTDGQPGGRPSQQVSGSVQLKKVSRDLKKEQLWTLHF